MDDDKKRINARISILAHYDNMVNVRVYDKKSGIIFLEIVMTHEQFINAAMNRLSNCEVKEAYISGLDKIGKTQEYTNFEFEISRYGDEDIARKTVTEKVPDGWIPDMSFNSQDSFFTKDGKPHARTIIRSWVDKT